MGDGMMSDQIRWFVGIDWASEQHHVALLDADGNRVEEWRVTHSGAELGQLCDRLLAKTGAKPSEIAVAIETPRGPVVETLLERGFQLYSINPKQLDRFRDRFTVAGAKDDSRDANVLGASLRTDRAAFRTIRLDDPLIIALREWVRIRDELSNERTRLMNRMRDQLWRYYPQVAQLGDDLGAEWLMQLWERVPTPQKAARVTEKALAAILKKHRIRRIDAAGALRILRQPPISVAPGTVEAATGHIQILIARLRLANEQIRDAERQLDQLCSKIEESTPGQICEQHDMSILRSFGGLGRINIATLLAEACEPLRRRDYHALRMLSGVAPVSRRSGKKWIVLRRYACNKRLALAVFHWARVAIQQDPISRDRYAALRQHGHSHGRALRTVGDRLLYVLCTLLERQTPFRPDYQNSQPATAT
jgi:transposase